jgi:hypothetical protein
MGLRFEAQHRGITLALLTADRFLLSPLEMRSLIDEVNSPWVRVALRPCVIARSCRPADWYAVLGHRIAHVLIEPDAGDAHAGLKLETFLPPMAESRRPSAQIVATFRLPGAGASDIRSLTSSIKSA